MTQSLRTHIQAQLALAGWQVVDSTALASKSFDTAVGVKQAFAYLKDFGPDNASVLLQGDYLSEGRNALEPWGTLIARDASPEQLAALVAKFAQENDAAVGQSYAARLLKAQA